MTLIQALRSNTFAIYIAIASVIVQSFHSFYAFYKISSLNGTGWGIAQAVLFAIIVDAAVLFYTVRKNTKVTWMAAFIMVLINLYVYWVHLGFTFDFALGALIAFVIPVSNYFYSEEIEVDDPRDVQYEPGQREEILKVEKELDQMKELVSKQRQERLSIESSAAYENQKARKYITELREEIKLRDEVIINLQEKQKKMIPIDRPEQIIIQTDGEYIKSPVDGSLIKIRESKGFASLKSPAQETPPVDKSLLGVDKIIATDRPIPE